MHDLLCPPLSITIYFIPSVILIRAMHKCCRDIKTELHFHFETLEWHPSQARIVTWGSSVPRAICRLHPTFWWFRNLWTLLLFLAKAPHQ